MNPRLILATIALVSAVCLPSICRARVQATTAASTQPSPDAKAACVEFLGLIGAGKIDEALAMCLPVTGGPPDEARRNLEQVAKLIARGEQFTTVDAAAIGDVALVVIVKHSLRRPAMVDPDPLIAAKRDGVWKFAVEDPQHCGLSEQELETVRVLTPWFEERREAIRAEAQSR